jgi:hypothetical protein
MSTPVVRKNGAVVSGSVVCPKCPHLLNRHQAEVAGGQCRDCQCIAQDVRVTRRHKA